MNVTKYKNVEQKKIVDKHLSLRNSANQLIDELTRTEFNKIILDFYDVQTISRSFAQQFLTRIDDSSKTFECINEPKNVKAMFEVVKSKNEKPTVVNTNTRSVVHMSTISLHG